MKGDQLHSFVSGCKVSPKYGLGTNLVIAKSKRHLSMCVSTLGLLDGKGSCGVLFCFVFIKLEGFLYVFIWSTDFIYSPSLVQQAYLKDLF